MNCKQWMTWIGIGLGLAVAVQARAAYFGKPVVLGGHVADLALDEGRGLLYAANYTANRVDVVRISDGTVQTSFNVPSQPSSVAISPDGRTLLIGHYSNLAAPGNSANGLTVIDLETRERQSYSMGSAPLGLAFAIDGRALIVTTTDFVLFDPVSGVSQSIETISGLAAKTLPVPPATFPPDVVAASVASSRDARLIYGLTDTFTFSYDVNAGLLRIRGYVSSPSQGPRVVSVSRDGSYYVAGWVLRSSLGVNLAQFPDPNGALNVGSHAVDSDRGLIYAQMPRGSGADALKQPPELQVLDAENLRVFGRMWLPENLAGKSVLDSAGNFMYSISDSGILILPVGFLNQAPQIQATVEDLVFRGNFCDRNVQTQEFGLYSPSGAAVDFRLSSDSPAVQISPDSGVTPAAVTIRVDPAAFQNIKGTSSIALRIESSAAVNVPNAVRLLLNNREPDQRGTFVNIPGKLVDILPDPSRDRFFVLRQDTNELLVYEAGGYSLVKRLKTGNTPTQMAITFDRRWLLVGNDNSQLANVFDLETLEPSRPVVFPGGHYPRSIAASARGILAACRVAGPVNTIDRIDLSARRATELASLGVYKNDIDINTTLVASPNGSSILAAQANGYLLLYNANADTFTISRHDFESLSGTYAASSFEYFVVGPHLLNGSLVPVRQMETASGLSSGFSFVEQFALRTTAPNASSPGVIQRIELPGGHGAKSTRMVEAPLLGTTGAVFTRTLAPLYSRKAIVNLTTSGFTVLPWNYDAAVAPPRIDRVVNAADKTPGMASGGLITIFGEALSPVNLATRELPLPTALGESCLTINGLPVPVLFVGPNQVNAQVPFELDGNVTMVLRTPGGVSDNFNLVVLPNAPAVFRSAAAENWPEMAAVVRKKNGQLATLSNPLRRGDHIAIYLTGLGRTSPAIETGAPAPVGELISVLTPPVVTLGGVPLPVHFAGLSPGQVGVYQIDAEVPGAAPLGLDQPLVISQGGYATTVLVRVLDN